MQDRHTGPAGYQDPLISIQEGTLAIRRYYFPTGAKRIRLAAITRVEEYAMGKATGRWRTWGSGDLVHWFNLDPEPAPQAAGVHHRPGPAGQAGRDPDDPDAFRAALAATGIPVSSRDPRGAGR